MANLVKYDTKDRLLACMIDEAEPTEQEKVQIARVEEAWSMLTNSLPRTVIVKLLIKEHGVSRSTAYEVIKLATDIFGNIGKTSRDGLKAMYAENYRRLAKAAEEDGDWQNAIIALDKAAKLEGAFDADKAPGMNPAEWATPGQLFVPTSDPDVFVRSQQVVDIESEDVTEG